MSDSETVEQAASRAADATAERDEAQAAAAGAEAAAAGVAAAQAGAALAEAQAAKAALEAAGAIEEAEEEMEWLKARMTEQQEAIKALTLGQATLSTEINRRQTEIKEMLESLKASISGRQEEQAENSQGMVKPETSRSEDAPSDQPASQPKKPSRHLL